jgi:signal transduction histidine kinase
MDSDSQSAALDAARLELARLHACTGESLREVWLRLAENAAQALGVERVGVWTLLDEGRTLRCRYLLQRSKGLLFQGAILRAQDFPTYFEALDVRRAIVAHDALGSATTNELREAYLEPLGITSMLDAPIFLEGRVAGVVCHEHIGEPRTWSDAECAFAGAVADNIARLYEERERHHAETTLETYQRHLMELHRLEAVGRMAAGIAHDFRGIAGAALGFAELIRRVPNLPEQADQYAQRVIEALERGRRLTQQVMHFGKDDPTSPRVLDVATSLDALSKMLRVLLGENVKLTLHLDRTASRIFMDAAQLERTVLNLVLNARDAMPEGGELKIAVQDVEENEDDEQTTYVAVSVSDTGCGMTEETRAKAFTPFFTTKGEHGTGLGLVIVDQIVSRSGGHVALESEPDRGTTVRVYLPRIAGAA